MKIQEQITLKGRLRIELNGVTVVDDDNLVVNMGKEWAAKMLGGVGKIVNKMKVGNNGAIPDPLQTKLVGTVLAELPLTNPGGDVYVNTIEFIATAQPGQATGNIQECGLFSQIDEMVARKSFAQVNKGVSDIMSFIWTLTVV